MFTRNLATSAEFLNVITNTAINTATPATASTAIDMKGYQSVTFVLLTNKETAGNTPVLSAKMGVNSTVSAMTAIANSSVAAASANITVQVLELARPSKRYVAPVVTGGTANTGNTVQGVAVLDGREPQQLGMPAANTTTGMGPGPLDNMVPTGGAFNTTTGVFSGSWLQSSANTPTSKLILSNP